MKPINENVEAHAIIGGNKQGKSALVAKLIPVWFDLRSDKIVVLNSSGPKAFSEYSYYTTPVVLRKKWHGIIRYHNPEGYQQTLKDVYQAVIDGYLYNGAVVFDDCSKYLTANPPQEIKDFLIDRRMYGLQLIFTTHALRFYPKFCRAVTNTITVFKTAEEFKSASDLSGLEYANSVGIFEAWKTVQQIPDDPKKFIQAHRTIETGI